MYKTRMFILLAVSAAAVLLLLSAFWLKFRWPGWEFALGISSLSDERRGQIDAVRLRRYLSVVFYAFSAVFFLFFLFLMLKTLPQKTVLAFCFPVLALFLDAVVLVYRHFDSADYSLLSRRAGLVCMVCVNLLFLGLFFFFLL